MDRVPTTPHEEVDAWVVGRPRLRRRLLELVGRFGLVWVRGSAGSGKTTAVAEAVGALPQTSAWLTLDTVETAPGRLLLALERTLRAATGDLPPAATEALASRVPHAEAARFLAEALGDRELVLVLDEVERVAEDDAEPARRVLAAFLRHLRPAVRVVLVSRRDVPLSLGSSRLGGVGHLDEEELALTVTEAEQVLAALDRPGEEAGAAVRATGGWVAGVLFEAWRSPDHVPGAGGEADAFSGYLSSEIMAGLAPAERWFLVATSVLRDVTAERAERLGLEGARELLGGLRAHHLPVRHAADGASLQCHPRFREFLRHRLDEHGGAEVVALHVAHGRLLLDEGVPEDAVDAFLRGGAVEEAEAAAEDALPAVLRRGDLAVAARWLRAFRRPSVETSAVLTQAELAVALEGEQWMRGAEVADRLLVMLALRPEAGRPALEPGLAGVIGTCFLHVGRLEDAGDVIELARPGPGRDAWRVALALDLVERPERYRDRPADRGETVDGLLHRYDLMHGRLGRLLHGRPAPWAASRSSRVAALRAAGRPEEALALFGEWLGVERSPAMTRIAVELLVDLGRVDEARATLARGREVAERSSPYCVLLHHLLEATFALRVDRDPAAARVALDRAEEDPTARRRTRVLEQLDLLRGQVALLEGDVEAAARHLRAAVATMLEFDRCLLLPQAGVLLAEAEWRRGDEAAADAAADHALRAAGVQGTDHLLLQALHDHPAVLSRRLDAEPGSDSPWHRLGRVLRADTAAGGLRTAPRAAAHLEEFGSPALLCDGRRVDPRLSRSVELLAHLAAHGGAAPRDEVLDDLFDGGRDDKAKAYLRQALKRLRDVLPEGRAVLAEDDEVRWAGGALTSDAVALEAGARDARLLHGRERADALLRALAAQARGPYFGASRTTWVAERREELLRLSTDLRLDAAETLFALDDLEQAEALATEVLRADPYRESAWRLAMRLAAATGQDDRVIALFRDCRERLADLPTEPSPSTRRLLEQLRR